MRKVGGYKELVLCTCSHHYTHFANAPNTLAMKNHCGIFSDTEMTPIEPIDDSFCRQAGTASSGYLEQSRHSSGKFLSQWTPRKS